MCINLSVSIEEPYVTLHNSYHRGTLSIQNLITHTLLHLKCYFQVFSTPPLCYHFFISISIVLSFHGRCKSLFGLTSFVK